MAALQATSQEIETKKVNIHKLFVEYWFRIPEYQRSYVWGSEELDDLLDDLHYARKSHQDKEYFLGSVVLQKRVEQRGSLTYQCYDVLDGQQRLTTLFLLMAVLRDIAEDARLKTNTSDAIFQEEDPFSNRPERIRVEFMIRDAVGHFVDTVIKHDKGTDDVERLKGLAEQPNVSLSNMASAVLFLREQLSKLEQAELNQFAIFLLNKVIVIYVASESMEDAFRLFTILNDRGIPLTNSDILKSINIGELTDERKRLSYAQMWEEWESEFERDGFDRFLGYIRTIVVKEKAREGLLDEFEKIYKKGDVKQGEETFQLIKTYREHYAALFWSDREVVGGDYRFRNLLTIMQAGLGATDWISPLLYFYEKFRTDNLMFFLQKLESKFAADRILQLSHTKRLVNVLNILKALDKAENSQDLLSHEAFVYDRNAVHDKLQGCIYNTNFGRYIMLKTEYLLQDHSTRFAPFERISVEHVLPQNPPEDSQWKEWFTDEQHQLWRHRLANLMLLSRRKNSKLSNRDFADKKARYFASSVTTYPNVVTVMQFDEWTPNVLEERQRLLHQQLMNEFK